MKEFLLIFLLLFKYSCFHFHSIMAPHPTHPGFPPSNPLPLALSMCPLHMFLDGPSPIFPHYPSPRSSLVTVCSLFQCFWLYFACWFVLSIRFHLQVKSYGICLTAWLISLSIIVFSSIHAVTKDRNSFLLSAA